MMPLFEVGLLSGNFDDRPQILQMVDTVDKQLRCIEDLYKIVKAQPRYKKLKDPVLKGDESPAKVIMWLLRKLGPLAKGDQWTVDTYIERGVERGVERYRFVVYKYYHRQFVTDAEQFVPLDFLPALKARDIPLHDMIIDLVALVSKVNKVPLWDEDGDFSEMLDFKGLDFVSDRLKRQSLSYGTGPAAQYLKLIKKRRKVVTGPMVQQQLDKYKNDSQRKHYACWWIRKGLELTRYYQHGIENNTYVPHYMHRVRPITPFRQYKWVWSLHDSDTVKIKAFNRLRGDDKHGTFLPVQFSITKPGEVVKVPTGDNFPPHLHQFMNDGYGLFLGQYRQYFYKQQYTEQQTPAERFLEAIEMASLRS